MQSLPWVALYAHRLARGSSAKDAALFGVFFSLNALSCWHYAVFTLFFVPWIWVFRRWARPDERSTTAEFTTRLALAGLVIVALLAPFTWSILGEIWRQPIDPP